MKARDLARTFRRLADAIDSGKLQYVSGDLVITAEPDFIRTGSIDEPLLAESFSDSVVLIGSLTFKKPRDTAIGEMVGKTRKAARARNGAR